MTMHTIPPTDAHLLSRYMQAGDEAAFAALVRAHERLVIGTAARITGNAESARDVAQQVFATLAQKAWMLTDRTSLAGWLHHAARHIALRTARSESARQRRHELVAAEDSTAPESDVWPMLEEALATLPDAEREAVVMHHLQDRSYAEMAAALGLTEPAVRKRVSRGLQSLSSQLRSRGFGGSAASLLVGAAALQVGSSSVAVAATVATAAPLSLTLTTLMAHTAIKLAVVVTLVSAVPIVWQTQGNSALREELATLQQQPRPIAPKPIVVRDNSALQVEAAALNDRLILARQAQEDAQARLVATQATVKQLGEEVVISHGKIEDLARSMMRKMMPMMDAMVALEKLNDSERAAKEAELMAQMGKEIIELIPLQKRVLKLEDRPADAAHFFAAALEEGAKLPSDVRQRIESTLLADFERLRNDGLSFPQRPKANAEAWVERRKAAAEEMQAHLMELLPPEARKHPLFIATDGFLSGISVAELDYLGEDAKATPQSPATKP